MSLLEYIGIVLGAAMLCNLALIVWIVKRDCNKSKNDRSFDPEA